MLGAVDLLVCCLTALPGALGMCIVLHAGVGVWTMQLPLSRLFSYKWPLTRTPLSNPTETHLLTKLDSGGIMPLLLHGWFTEMERHVPMSLQEKSQHDSGFTKLINYHEDCFTILPFFVYKLLPQCEKHNHHHMPCTQLFISSVYTGPEFTICAS